MINLLTAALIRKPSATARLGLDSPTSGQWRGGLETYAEVSISFLTARDPNRVEIFRQLLRNLKMPLADFRVVLSNFVLTEVHFLSIDEPESKRVLLTPAEEAKQQAGGVVHGRHEDDDGRTT